VWVVAASLTALPAACGGSGEVDDMVKAARRPTSKPRAAPPQAALNSWAGGTAERIDDAIDAAKGDDEAAGTVFVQLGCEGILGHAFKSGG
jgi:hypothetical protein